METKKLYLVSTPSLHSYVIAESPNQAQETLEKWLRKNDYGFIKDRDVVEIKLIAKEGIAPNHCLEATDQLLFWEPEREEHPMLATKLRGEK